MLIHLNCQKGGFAKFASTYILRYFSFELQVRSQLIVFLPTERTLFIFPLFDAFVSKCVPAGEAVRSYHKLQTDWTNEFFLALTAHIRGVQTKVHFLSRNYYNNSISKQRGFDLRLCEFELHQQNYNYEFPKLIHVAEQSFIDILNIYTEQIDHMKRIRVIIFILVQRLIFQH